MTREKIEMGQVDGRVELHEWIVLERARYADVKYDEDTDARHKLILDMQNFGNLEDDSEWWTFISNYLSRARTLGLTTPQGRQALAKCIVTMMHCLETAIDVHGHLPKPGQPSGELVEWTTLRRR